MSTGNVVVALTNLVAYYPIKKAFNKKDFFTGNILLFVFIFSFISHLFESHKHGMIGFHISPNISYILNRFDVLGCVMIIIRFLYLLYKQNIQLPSFNVALFGTFSFLCLRISEYDKYNKNYRTMYMITHSIWHITVYLLMEKLLDY